MKSYPLSPLSPFFLVVMEHTWFGTIERTKQRLEMFFRALENSVPPFFFLLFS